MYRDGADGGQSAGPVGGGLAAVKPIHVGGGPLDGVAVDAPPVEHAEVGGIGVLGVLVGQLDHGRGAEVEGLALARPLDGLGGAGADELGGPFGRQAGRAMAGVALLDRDGDDVGPEQVADLRAELLAPGGHDHRHPHRPGEGAVHPDLADLPAVDRQPEPGGAAHGVLKHAVQRPGLGVVAKQDQPVEAAVQARPAQAVGAGAAAVGGAGVQPGQVVVERAGVVVPDDDLLDAGVDQPLDGGIHVAGGQFHPLGVHPSVGGGLKPAGDAGDALHVHADHDLHANLLSIRSSRFGVGSSEVAGPGRGRVRAPASAPSGAAWPVGRRGSWRSPA